MRKFLLIGVSLLLIAGCVREKRRALSAEPGRESAVAAPAAEAKEEAGARHEQSIRAGVAFLLRTQKKNGAWGDPLPERPADIYTGGVNSFHAFGNASSALCCMALLAQPSEARLDAALLKGYRFLCDAPDAVRINGDTFYNIWAHAYMIEALSRGLQDKRLEAFWPEMRKRAHFEIGRLFKIQSLDGGFGYYDFGWVLAHPTGEISTPMSSTAALVGLRAAKDAGLEIPEKGLRLALEFLNRMRLPNGAYLYATEHQYAPTNPAVKVRGSLGRSQGGNCALGEWGQYVDRSWIEKGFETFIREHIFIDIGRCRQYPHEAWYATAPYYYYFGHYYASRNLFLIGDSVRRLRAQWLADTIAASQFDDGSFWDYPLFGYTKAYGTGYGVLIMSNCRQVLAAADQ
ncbi:MAG: hypothetical protein IT461_00750 [Planctomycetes bacterium]|nr:hypothetical protein [Planctomycetota bacterium]